MISPLHLFGLLLILVGAMFNQFTLPQILIGALFIVVVLAVVQHWALRHLNADPADDVDNSLNDKNAEILGDVPVRSKVGTPRARRLQPLRTGDEPSRSASETLVPADSLAMAGAAAFAKPKESSRTIEPPSPTITPVDKDRPAPAADKPALNKGIDAPAKDIILPPLSAADVVGSGTKSPETIKPTGDKPREASVLPPLSVKVPPAAEPASKPPAAKEKAIVPVSPAEKNAPISPVVPLAEKVADGIVAVGQPAPPASTEAASPETDDVKKRKTPPSASGTEQPRPGLIIIPKDGAAKAEAVPAAAASPAPAVEPIKPAEPSVAPAPEAKTEAGKSGGRPRIFLPANLPASTDKLAEPAKPAVDTKPANEPPSSVNPGCSGRVESTRCGNSGQGGKQGSARRHHSHAGGEARGEAGTEDRGETRGQDGSETRTEDRGRARGESRAEARTQNRGGASAEDRRQTRSEGGVIGHTRILARAGDASQARRAGGFRSFGARQAGNADHHGLAAGNFAAFRYGKRRQAGRAGLHCESGSSHPHTGSRGPNTQAGSGETCRRACSEAARSLQARRRSQDPGVHAEDTRGCAGSGK